MNKELQVIQNLESQLPVSSAEFEAASVDNRVSYVAEAGYAMQLLRNNSYLDGIARKNIQSLRDAIINIAAIGTTLNPAEKKAYLVPRGGSVCLDISYRGLADIAVNSGACEWIEPKLVYENDEYTPGGLGELPIHKPANPFKGGQGKLIGVYAAAKRHDGSYAVSELNMNQVNSIKARSESGKKNKGPWSTDFYEMVKKTAVKNVVKKLQGCSARVDAAIHMLNQQGEGIDFNNEHRQQPKDVNCSAEAKAAINDLLKQVGMNYEDVPIHVVGAEAGTALEDLTEFEAGKLTSMLETKLRAMKRSQQ